MNIKLFISHSVVGIFGFALGIYLLPILTAREAPSAELMTQAQNEALFTGEFKKDLTDSDFFHWGEGKVSIGQSFISLDGSLAPGPDYQLYLSPKFIDTEAEFVKNKDSFAHVAEVKTYENFVVKVPQNINPAGYQAVIIWCETFGEFITAAKYQ